MKMGLVLSSLVTVQFRVATAKPNILYKPQFEYFHFLV